MDITLQKMLFERMEYLVDRVQNHRYTLMRQLNGSKELFPFTSPENIKQLKKDLKEGKANSEENLKTAQLIIDSFQIMNKFIKVLFDISKRDNVQLSDATKLILRGSTSLHPILRGETEDYLHPDAVVGHYSTPEDDAHSRYVLDEIKKLSDLDNYLLLVKRHHILPKGFKKPVWKNLVEDKNWNNIVNSSKIYYNLSAQDKNYNIKNTRLVQGFLTPLHNKLFGEDTGGVIALILAERIANFDKSIVYDLKLPECEWLNDMKAPEIVIDEPIKIAKKKKKTKNNKKKKTAATPTVVEQPKVLDLTNISEKVADPVVEIAKPQEAEGKSPESKPASPKAEKKEGEPKKMTKGQKKIQKKREKDEERKKEATKKDPKKDTNNNNNTDLASTPSGHRKFSNSALMQPLPTSGIAIANNHMKTLADIFNPSNCQNVTFKAFKALWKVINGEKSIKTPGSGGSHRSLLNSNGKIVGFTYAPHGGQTYTPKTIGYLQYALDMVGFGENYLKENEGK